MHRGRRAQRRRLCGRARRGGPRGRADAGRAGRALPRQRFQAVRPELRRHHQQCQAGDADVCHGLARDRHAAPGLDLDGEPERRARHDLLRHGARGGLRLPHHDLERQRSGGELRRLSLRAGAGRGHAHHRGLSGGRRGRTEARARARRSAAARQASGHHQVRRRQDQRTRSGRPYRGARRRGRRVRRDPAGVRRDPRLFDRGTARRHADARERRQEQDPGRSAASAS